MAARANSPRFESFGSAGLPNLPNLPFSEFGSQSNTNSESSKSTVFRIGTNQTHPKLIDRIVRNLIRKIIHMGISLLPGVIIDSHTNTDIFQPQGRGADH